MERTFLSKYPNSFLLYAGLTKTHTPNNFWDNTIFCVADEIFVNDECHSAKLIADA